MKITEILKKEKFIFSCEFFPPKTDEGMAQLFETLREIKELEPRYISVTYGAGGGTREKTIDIVARAKRELGIEGMAHLTCVGHSKSELRNILDHIRDTGIKNLMALRGDPPKGETGFTPHPDGYRHASELVAFARQNYDLCIGVAGYPEGHTESQDLRADWDRLADKVLAGADFIVTQLFFNNAAFFAFEKGMRDRGIKVPIIPGIMPITNYNQIVKFSQMCGAKIPEDIARRLDPVKDDLEAVARIGVEVATRQCEELLERGAAGIHFYTLNKSHSTKAILQTLRKKYKG